MELWSGHELFPPFFVSSWREFKDYAHYKTITSQNVLSEAQIKSFFILWKSYVPFLRYSSFCIFNHLMIYQICEVMMSISTWEGAFLNIFWTTTHNVNILGQLIDISKGNTFQGSFEQFEGQGVSSRAFSI